MDLEDEIRRLRSGGDLRAAATRAVEGYGPEVLGFLVTILREEHDANEVFSQACEDLWAGLGSFEGRCSFRTWFYTLARHAASRLQRSPGHRSRNRGALNELSEVAAQVRSRTLPHLRTDVKDRFAAIRNALAEDDRALLVLRVDRDLNWRDIARVFSPGDESEDALNRAAATLRKRFQAVKDEIKERARAAGLLTEAS
jgi:RNA polymerase sigma-70 factor (ECF subfamily)